MLRIGLQVSLYYDIVHYLLGTFFHSTFDFIHDIHTHHSNATTNTILLSVKLLFDPAEPVMVGPIKVQGLFESRQVEVSEEFGRFMAGRVLNSRRILE